MSENETDPNEAVPGRVPSPGPPAVHGTDDEATSGRVPSPGPAAVPGDDPEDNPDLEGEDRFDAG